jgi:zinc/manganese transport system substrate-binding protein
MSTARVSFVVAAMALIAGCSSSDDAGFSADRPPRVAVTTSIWADVVSNIVCGDLATIVLIVPNGTDAHSFEPSLADRARLEDARLVVANGLGFESRLIDTIEAVEGAGTAVFRFGDHVDPLADDPHLWLDPSRVGQSLDALVSALIDNADLDPVAVRQCASDYADELVELDRRVVELIDAIPAERRLLVTNHDALGYFADRYDLRVVGSIIPANTTLAETNPAQLSELARLIADANLPAIFAETLSPRDDADALGQRLGDVVVVTLHTEALTDAAGAASTYIDMVRTDAELISEALR